MKQTQNIEIYQ